MILYAVGEPANIISQEVFLEAEAFWEHTCIAGGLFLCRYNKTTSGPNGPKVISVNLTL